MDWAHPFVISNVIRGRTPMAKYSRSAGKDVERAMHRRKKGKLKRGKGGKGGKVKSRKQAIAIGLSEARKKGKKAPQKKSSGKKRRSPRARKTSLDTISREALNRDRPSEFRRGRGCGNTQ